VLSTLAIGVSSALPGLARKFVMLVRAIERRILEVEL
jgi:hypothetical protein